MSLYVPLLQMAYESMTNGGDYTPDSDYVEWELGELRPFAFADCETADYIQMLKASPTEDAVDGVETHLDDETSFEEAVRQRAYEVFAGDLFRKLLDNGHGTAIPDFFNYEMMLKAEAQWAEEKAAEDGVEAPPEQLIEGDLRDGTLSFADTRELVWLAEHVSADVDTTWIENDESRVADDGYWRDEMEALADAVVSDAIEYLDT